MREWVEEYLEHLGARGLSEGTIRGIRYQLKWFYDYLRARGTGEVSREVIRDWRNYLVGERRQKAAVIYGRLGVLRRYFIYLTERGRYLRSPMEGLDIPKRGKSVRGGIPSEAEIQEIILGIDLRSGEGKRDRAVVELLYSTGMRRSELAGLDIYDVDFSRQVVRIRKGKGGQGRVIPFGRCAKEALELYLRQARAGMLGLRRSAALFVTARPAVRLSAIAVGEILWRLTRRRRIRISPHGLRHACAAGMMRHGAGIRHIQELLGHKRISTTAVYTQMTAYDLKEAHRKYHPRG